MNKIYIVSSPPTIKNLAFDQDDPNYYPPAFCEMLHASNAVYVATALQLIFLVILSCLYYFFEQNDFILAVEVFRPALIFVGIVNLSGICCALIGVFMEREMFVGVQNSLLTGLVVISDLIALSLVMTMAIGTRSKFTQRLPGYLVDADRFEAVLGPFWIYLCAILFHMLAASITCLIGVNRKYTQYLKVLVEFIRQHPCFSGQERLFSFTVGNIDRSVNCRCFFRRDCYTIGVTIKNVNYFVFNFGVYIANNKICMITKIIVGNTPEFTSKTKEVRNFK
ncbi:hypothetical protein M3Y96_00365200 [Aphelenchoides besseyi]|nr:hypothetical protein M3Y96_00365200 [Aphelenchoides besseyi]